MAGGGFGSNTNNVKADYPGKLTWFVLITCIVAAMGGLIFGYDIGISGGVTSMTPFLKKFFPSVYRKEEQDHSNNQYCTFDSQLLTLFTSSLYFAALLASLVASWVTTKLGRKISMLIGGVVFLVGSILNGLAVHISMLIIGRILLGVGVGFSIQSVPLYVSEMAPCKSRGALNILFNLSITIGILLANVINYFTAKIEGGWGWRISLGGAAIPAIFIVVAAFFLPDTPNSMIDRDQPNKARAMLRKIRGVNDEEVEAEFNDLMEASKASKEAKNQWRNITKRKYRPQLTMAVLIPAFQQLTGINVVMFYAPVLFKTIGFGSDASLMAAVITGLVNVLSTFISIYGVDKWGRRILLLAGGSIMCVFQIVLAVFIRWQFGDSGVVTTVLPNWYPIVVVICICAFVFAFAWSWGPLAWLVPSEIFPLEIRSVGQSITVSTNMLLTYGVAQSFLSMLCHMKYGLFIFFACFVAIMTLFIFFFLPETKNIPIEEMSRVWRKHWFWRKFVLEDNSYKGFTGDIENDIVD